MLDTIMLRNDLTGTEQRICYYLIRFRTNSDTSLCYISDEALARNLGVTRRAIQKCKRSLKQKKLLSWTTERRNGKHEVSLYRVIYREGENCSSLYSSELQFTTNTTKTNGSSLTNTSSPANSRSLSDTATTPTKFYAKFGSAELDAWARWSQETGTNYPRDRAGGWEFPSRWPPKPELTLSQIFDL